MKKISLSAKRQAILIVEGLAKKEVIRKEQVSQLIASLLNVIKNEKFDPLDRMYDFAKGLAINAIGELVKKDVVGKEQSRELRDVLLSIIMTEKPQLDYAFTQHSAINMLGKLVEKEIIAKEQLSQLLTSLLKAIEDEKSNRSEKILAVYILEEIGKEKVLEKEQLSRLVAFSLRVTEDEKSDPNDKRSAINRVSELAKKELVGKEQLSKIITLLLSIIEDEKSNQDDKRSAINTITELAKKGCDLPISTEPVDITQNTIPFWGIYLANQANKSTNFTNQKEYLFDHLEGKLPLLQNIDENINANTDAVHREIVIQAIAWWMMNLSKEERQKIENKLKAMYTDKRLHLRIAACNIFVKAAEFQAEIDKEKEQSSEK